MSFYNSFIIAKTNIFNRKKTSLKVILSFVLVLTFIITGLSYLFMTQTSLEKVMDLKASQNKLNLTLWYGKEENTAANKAYSKDLIDKIKNIEGVSEVVAKSKGNNIDYYEGQKRFLLTLNDTELIISFDDTKKVYKSADDERRFSADFVSLDGGVVSTAEVQEFLDEIIDDSIFWAGTEMKNPNQIVLSDDTLMSFGIEHKDFESLIGKKISLINNKSENDKKLIDNLELSGIVKSSFTQKTFCSEVWIATEKSFTNPEYDIDITVYMKDFKYYRKNIDVISKMMGQDVDYDDYTLFLVTELEKQESFVSSLLLTFGSIITISLLVLIIHTLSYHVKQKQHYYGLIKSLGSDKIGIFKLFFCEFLILGVASIITSFIASFGLTHLINELVYLSEGFSIEFSINIIIKNFIWSSVLAMILVLIMTIYFSVYTNSKKPYELLLAKG